MAFAETARLIASLELDASKFNRGVGSALGGVGKLDRGLGRAGRGAGQLATGLGRAGLFIGGAVVAGLGAAAKSAIDFESAFAGVRKTVNESDLTAVGLSFDKLATSFRTMATEIPIAATDLAMIGETAGALGIRAQDIEAFTKTVALLGQTTNLSTDAAAEALGKVGTILHLTGRDFEAFADTLVNLGNQGASTEDEIIEVTKRFAAVGRQAGLTTDQILALSSAATSLGAEPEAAGSALSRIFANMTTEIADGSAKGKEFAKITGDSLDELRKRLNKGDALGILQETLKGISGLSRTEAASVLEALGIKNVRDRDAILKMAQNLGFVNDQLNIAAHSTGALGIEAQKRFDTIASKLTILKNNAIEAGITIGEGMLPAIGRAASKLTEFLKDPVNKAQLKALGEDIGSTIDKIDWKNVLDGAKTFFGVLKDAAGIALDILKTLNALPTEVKAAGLGLIGLNKLSGGLIGAGVGNIVGGLASAMGGALVRAGIGKAFVQPVFVTNMGAGMGGAGSSAGGGGIVGPTIIGAAAVQGAMDAATIAEGVSRGYQASQEGDVQGILDAQRDILANTVMLPPGLKELGGIFASKQQEVVNQQRAAAERITTRVEGMKGAMVQSTARAADRSVNAAERTKSAIVQAIHGIQRPIVSVSVTGNQITTVYSTGGTVTRNVQPGILKLL